METATVLKIYEKHAGPGKNNRWKRWQAGRFNDWLTGRGKKIELLSRDEIGDYLASLGTGGLKGRAVNRAKKALETVCVILEAEGTLTANPLEGVRMVLKWTGPRWTGEFLGLTFVPLRELSGEGKRLLALYEEEKRHQGCDGKKGWELKRRWAARRFVAWCDATGLSLRDLDRERIRTCLADVYERERSFNTVKNLRTTIVELLALAVRDGMIGHNPLEGVTVGLSRGKSFRVDFDRVLSPEGAETVRRYDGMLAARSLTEGARQRECGTVSRFLAWLEGRGKKAAVTAEDVAAYCTARGSEGLTVNGVRAQKTTLQNFVRRMHPDGPLSRKKVSLRKGAGYAPTVEAVRDRRPLTAAERDCLDGFIRFLGLRQVKLLPRHEAEAREYLDFLAEKGKGISESGEADLEEFRSGLLASEKKLSRGTINQKFLVVRQMYRYLYEKRAMATDPSRELRLLSEGVCIPKNILDVGETGTLLSSLPLKTPTDLLVRTISEVLYGCAVRISEAVALRLIDLTADRGFVWITEAKNRGKRRMVPLAERTEQWLTRYRQEGRELLLTAEERKNGWVFPHREGAIIALLNRRLKKTCLSLGLPPLSTHSFRHSAATHMLRKGAGIRQVQAFLGHESIASTQQYTRVVKDDLKKCVAACHPRELLFASLADRSLETPDETADA